MHVWQIIYYLYGPFFFLYLPYWCQPLTYRPVPDSECGSPGVWRVCKGQSKSSGQRSRRFQCIKCLFSRDCENIWRRGTNGDGTDGEGGGGVCVCVDWISVFLYLLCLSPLRHWVGPHFNGTVLDVKKKDKSQIILHNSISGTCP